MATLEVPDYLMPRPPMPADPAALAAFDALFEEVEAWQGKLIDYRLELPIWQFLAYLADTRDVLLHGSGNPDIAEFEPRKSDDVNEFGDRKAVYAASDALWAMYFAILDRDHHPMSLINSSVRIESDHGSLTAPYYFFSISETARAARAFRAGTVYLLPRETFEQQAPLSLGGRRIHLAHWASPLPVRPLARFAVRPDDFPLLDAIRGHDDESTFARARANPDGFPWLEE